MKTLTDTTTEIFFTLKAADVKLPKTSLDSMSAIKFVGGICRWVLVKYYEA